MDAMSTDAMPSRREVWRGADRVCRVGYVAKGVVYGIVGILAVQYAFFAGGDAAGSRDALQSLAGSTWGFLLLFLIGVGLIGYVFLRFMQAFLDVEHKGTDAKGLGTRAGYLISGVIYSALSFAAFRLAFWGRSAGNSGSEQQQEAAVAGVLALPFGRWLVGIAGVIVAAVGVYFVFRAVTKKFMREYNTSQMNSTERTLVRRVGQYGILARAVTFLIIGWFLMLAAVQRDATEAKNLAESLQVVMSQPYGPWMVAIVGVGFIAYAAYSFSRARYRDRITH